MKNLLHFIVRFHFTILFIVFEIFCLLLLVNYNNYQKSEFLNSSNAISGGIYQKVSSVTDYLSLAKTNEELNRENVRLRNLLHSSYKLTTDSSFIFLDTIYKQQYIYRTAKIINNSVNKQLNYITLNKGKIHGIEREMAVVTDNGVVGVVKSVSDNFASVISVLNDRLRISAKLKGNNYHGSLIWDGVDYRKAMLKDIPFHVKIAKGDTIVTSGYSAIFPEGLQLGVVDEVMTSSGSNFQNIKVLLSNDFKSLSYVKVVGDLMKEERLKLEEEATE
ncbi:rod shape-determining protein MreC [Marinifilum sp. D737]|jgi:rod shape-determining protein MreC|uniref:rod shape-determining protein MreC n=1 Tax=Marinifilum sp. D737 TaxID=2969628 RepID=UPI00227492E4|nr:rod shape-determining protein MreC [Marinifilum sp. D737]MCY1632797.1 rod shape-determining protein MreC [Marinifilum sp. D737]